MSETSPASVDFFVSYTGADKAWAEWVAWQLEQKGYRTLIQEWDFKSGGVFPGDMHRALQNSARVIAILTPAYMESGFCQPEWQAAFADDPTGVKGALVLVRVADFKPDGLLRGRTYIDLVKLDEKAAAERLLARLDHAQRAKPATAPGFPGAATGAVSASAPAAAQAPAFPGAAGTGAASSSQPVLHSATPNNLPRLLPFFGRERELAVVREALDAEARTWGALIDGPGGMGKTSLAVRAAYDCAPGQFQRIIFVSIKDREMEDDGPRHLGSLLVPGFLAMLNEIARELGLADFGKSPEDQRVRLLLEALRGAGVLLVLDNLESLAKTDRDELLTFVKRLPQGCKAILTSRRRIGSSADTLILEKLEPQAALDLLAELALRNPLLARTSEAERMTLHTQTGGKPLLLRWVAGQLGRGRCRTFTDALHFLRTCPADNDPLEFIFGDLAREFDDMETRVLVALSYFTLPAKVEHIAAVAGIELVREGQAREPGTLAAESTEKTRPTPGTAGTQGAQTGGVAEAPLRATHAEVEGALAGLANRSLVVPEQEEEAHTLVPLVAEFLRKHRPEVMQETGDRLEKRAYALILENGYQKHDRFPVLDAAWPGVAPAIPRLLAGENARLQEVCDALQDFLNFTGRWDERLALCQQAAARAAAAGDAHHAGWRACEAGWIHCLRQQAEAVLACAARAAGHWERAFPPDSGGQDGRRERSVAIRLRGMGHRLKQDYPAAITACREALELRRSLAAESEDVASALNDLAGVERLSGDLPAAERDWREALRVARAVGYAEGVATYTGNLAALALHREDWAGAEALAREALPLSEKLGRQQIIASNCHRLALALARQGKAAEGVPYARRAVEILARLGSPEFAVAKKLLALCEGGGK